MRVKQLQQQFAGKGEVKDFEFTQIQQSNRAYIYKVDTQHSVCYEVFRKKSKTNSKVSLKSRLVKSNMDKKRKEEKAFKNRRITIGYFPDDEYYPT